MNKFLSELKKLSGDRRVQEANAEPQCRAGWRKKQGMCLEPVGEGWFSRRVWRDTVEGYSSALWALFLREEKPLALWRREF